MDIFLIKMHSFRRPLLTSIYMDYFYDGWKCVFGLQKKKKFNPILKLGRDRHFFYFHKSHIHQGWLKG